MQRPQPAELKAIHGSVSFDRSPRARLQVLRTIIESQHGARRFLKLLWVLHVSISKATLLRKPRRDLEKLKR